MKASEELNKLAPALAKAQAEMGGAVKDSKNPFFKSSYADLTSVWQACKEALHNNGFSVVQSPTERDGRIGVTTMLLHESGQFLMGGYTLGVKKDHDPQADGSSITYARRYALAAFVGVCPVDDDAEGAMARPSKHTKQFDAKKLTGWKKEIQDAAKNLTIEQYRDFYKGIEAGVKEDCGPKEAEVKALFIKLGKEKANKTAAMVEEVTADDKLSINI